ncbi:MAG: site-specific integrase [Alphaproteobacteria bacterium]|nr:site-specific integrase [Alphaproteobacteria bacterium]
MSDSPVIPRPLFDTLEQVCDLYKRCQIDSQEHIIKEWLNLCLPNSKETLSNEIATVVVAEYGHALRFLYSYRGSFETFNAYRREIDRFLQWSWFIQQKPILQLKRLDIEAFIEFCQKPPKRWIASKMVARFMTKDGATVPNPEWRPFIVKIPKKAFQDGERPNKASFELSQQGIKQIFAVLGSFYNALIQEEVTEINPVVQIRQKSKFIRKSSDAPMIRRLSDKQWQMVLKATRQLAEEDPKKHKRTLFMLQLLYGMYLRISELASSQRWSPKMSDFFRDTNGDWWFRTVGKGNKMRQIAVSDSMLEALKKYRGYLGYSPLPAPDDQEPLIPKERGTGAMESTRVIRQLIQTCFDAAVSQLRTNNDSEEAEILRSATVHWLRHTGISEDVKHRPREHVRDDAGHRSGAITDRYIDVELKARANTAKNKTWGEKA